MGAYLNPPTKEHLATLGRPIGYCSSYHQAVAQLLLNECLVGLYNRLIFNNAVWLYDEREFEAFESQAARGEILRQGFWAIPRRHMPEPYKSGDAEQGKADLTASQDEKGE